MFSGIIESTGRVVSAEPVGTNLRLFVECDFQDELKIDQSIAHNGVCLTVVSLDSTGYGVDIIKESLDRTNLSAVKIGDILNLERCVRLNDRLDGHLVQGHVDQTAEITKITDNNGSWTFRFSFPDKPLHAIIEKGSICVNGISLTISSLHDKGFEVSVIPYTYSHTNFKNLSVGDEVNIEFDVIGKYVEKLVRI